MRKGIQTERGEIEIDTERVREIKMKIKREGEERN